MADLQSATVGKAQRIYKKTTEGLLKPYMYQRSLQRGSRPPYWTDNLEEIRKRRGEENSMGKRTGMFAACHEHEELEAALKRTVRREKGTREKGNREEILRAPLYIRAQALKKDRRTQGRWRGMALRRGRKMAPGAVTLHICDALEQ